MDEKKCPYIKKKEKYISFKIEEYKIVNQSYIQQSQEDCRQTLELFKMISRYLFISNGASCIALLYNMSKFVDLGVEKPIQCFSFGVLFSIIAMVCLCSTWLTFFKFSKNNAIKSLKESGEEIVNLIYDINKENEETDNSIFMINGVNILSIPWFSLLTLFMSITLSAVSFFIGVRYCLLMFGVNAKDIFF